MDSARCIVVSVSKIMLVGSSTYQASQGETRSPYFFFFFLLFYFLDAASSYLLLSTFEGESLPCFEPRLLGWVLPHLPAEKARLDRPRPQR